MFVSAVCLLFLTRGLIVFMNVKLVRVSQDKPVSAGHYLQHHAESRDHPLYYLSRSLRGWHPKMKIHHHNGRALPHQAETQGITMLLKT